MVDRKAGPVRGSTTGRPVMVLLDLLGKRWTMRILWEMQGERLTFRALQDRCGISPTVLNDRLKALRAHGIVDLETGGYGPTAQGQELRRTLLDLDAWARKWMAPDNPEESPPSF